MELTSFAALLLLSSCHYGSYFLLHLHVFLHKIEVPEWRQVSGSTTFLNWFLESNKKWEGINKGLLFFVMLSCYLLFLKNENKGYKLLRAKILGSWSLLVLWSMIMGARLKTQYVYVRVTSKTRTTSFKNKNHIFDVFSALNCNFLVEISLRDTSSSYTPGHHGNSPRSLGCRLESAGIGPMERLISGRHHLGGLGLVKVSLRPWGQGPFWSWREW